MSNNLKRGSDFIKLAEKNSRVRNIRQNGSHVYITMDDGNGVCVPNHCKDLPNGTRHSIMKRFIRLGIILAPVIVIAYYFGYLNLG